MPRLLVSLVVGSLCLIGCSPATPPVSRVDETKKKDEDEVKQGFKALQTALKAKDADKIWTLLVKDSQDDAGRQAKAVKETYGKLSDKDKPAYEKKLGLTGQEVAEVTGKLYVKSTSFLRGEVDELKDSTLDKVVFTGDNAVVHYTEEHGDKEKLPAVREQGQWRFAVPVPKALLP